MILDQHRFINKNGTKTSIAHISLKEVCPINIYSFTELFAASRMGRRQHKPFLMTGPKLKSDPIKVTMQKALLEPSYN